MSSVSAGVRALHDGRHRERLLPITYRRRFNCFLVLEEDYLTLIDTGPAGAAPLVLRRMKQTAF
jgi:hypothetical protein